LSTWSAGRARFPLIVPRSDLPAREPKVNPDGTAAIRPLAGTPEWLYKEFHSPLARSENDRIDRLIRLPQGMNATDRAVVDGAISWPVARVVAGTTTVGVLIPKAPARFYATVLGVHAPLKIDLLAKSRPDYFREMGLPVPSLTQRIDTCLGLATVGSVFERHGLVYADWAYQNALWSMSTFDVYVIDTDECSFGARTQHICSPGFEDSLTDPSEGHTAPDAGTDRYRLAVLIARCLTGLRDTQQAWRALDSMGALDPRLAAAAGIVSEIFSARERLARPTLTALRRALAGSPVASAVDDRVDSGANVTGWMRVDVLVPAGSSQASVTTSRPFAAPPQPSVPTVPSGAGGAGGWTAAAAGPRRRRGAHYIKILIYGLILYGTGYLGYVLSTRH
jgi:hypothetical protein